MDYQLIALDLDGTLNNDQHRITPKTQAALLAAQSCGIRVVLASARPAPGLSRERAALQLDRHHGLLLSYNGCRIQDATTGQWLFKKDMDRRQVTAILNHLAQFPVAVLVDDGSRYYTNDAQGYMVAYECGNVGIPCTQVDHLAQAITFDTPKVLVMAPPEVLDATIPKITQGLTQTYDFYRTGPFYFEVAIKNFSKAQGLKIICDQLHIPREAVMAFGDSANDAQMLQYAGLGVAMGNASPELKAVADLITRSNNEDGIVPVLQTHCHL